MRWTGPAAVALFGPEGVGYRALRDTVPWKLIGFLCGGTVMILGPIVLVERRLRWQAVAVAVVATVAMIVIYDLPFDDLLLPPNGDV